MTSDEILKEHVFNLFANLEDHNISYLVETCTFFVREWNFDVDELPEKLRNDVITELKMEAQESEGYFAH